MASPTCAASGRTARPAGSQSQCRLHLYSLAPNSICGSFLLFYFCQRYAACHLDSRRQWRHWEATAPTLDRMLTFDLRFKTLQQLSRVPVNCLQRLTRALRSEHAGMVML